MSTASQAVFSAFLLVCSGACADQAAPPPVPRGIGHEPGVRPGAQESLEIRRPGGPLSRDPGAPPSNRVLLEAPPPAPAIVVTERQERPGTEVVRARDYSAELRTMAGDPSPCLSASDRALGRTLAFQLEVDVLSSGRVVDARVTSPGVSAGALDCIAAALRQARFEPFTDGTRSVQTPVVLQLVAPD